MTPEQQQQIAHATKRAHSLKLEGRDEGDVIFTLRQEGFHVMPRRRAIAEVFGTEQAMQKLHDMGQEWDNGQ